MTSEEVNALEWNARRVQTDIAKYGHPPRTETLAVAAGTEEARAEIRRLSSEVTRLRTVIQGRLEPGMN